jgi:hypothetical protein
LRTIERDIADLLERDPGMRCAYCAALLAEPPQLVGMDAWEAKGWSYSEFDDGGAWLLAEGFASAHRDHVHPRSKGGTDDLDNLVLSCDACNISKGATSLVVWFAKRSGCPRYRSVGGDHSEALARAWGAA